MAGIIFGSSYSGVTFKTFLEILGLGESDSKHNPDLPTLE